MLNILQSIFGDDEPVGRYPASLIEQAIERAVQGVYPRLLALPNYRARLEGPVIAAIDQIIALVDALPAPLPADSGNYSAQPLLSTLFVSPEEIRRVFANDPTLGEYRAAQPGGEVVTALLLAECTEKKTLGMALEGELVHRDVAQITINFGKHRLLDPAGDEPAVRRLLKRRAFDHLISLALWRISEAQSEYAELKQQRDLLRGKLSILQQGGWSFGGSAAEPDSADGPQAELERLETELDRLRIDEHSMTGQLDILAEVLTGARQHLWTTPHELHLDRMNVKRDAQHPDARTIHIDELHNARGERMALLLVTLDPRELPERPSFAAQSDRLLAELGPSFRR